MIAGLDDVERDEADKDAGDHEGQAEECSGTAVDGGGALGGVVWESGRQAGTAAKHALLDGAGSFGGGSDGEGHGCALGQSAGGSGDTQWDCAKEVRCPKGLLTGSWCGIYT